MRAIFSAIVVLVLAVAASAADSLRYVLIDEQQSLYGDGEFHSGGVARGLGLAAVAVVDRGQAWEQRPGKSPVLEYTGEPRLEIWINRKLTPLAAGRVEAYSQAFGDEIHRVSLRVWIDQPINDLRVFVYGAESRVDVEHAAERFPCTVRRVEKVGNLITLCDGKSPPLADLESLGWMLGGTIDTTLPRGSIELGYDSEVDAAQQYRQIGKCWRSIDFVVQPLDSHLAFGPPLVLERSKWSPLFAGDLEDKRDIELALHKQYQSLVYLRRGWATFGDWPHEPGTGVKKRCHYNDHYFTVTALHRAAVRSQTPELWCDMARVASAYTRDMCWAGGWKSHGKGLTPWSGPWGVAEHWVDSESLLMAWLVDGDRFARSEYTAWLKAWRGPQGPARESCVAKRMCDAAFAYTGDSVWRDRADAIQLSVLADIEAGKPGTGYLWHPEWCDKAILREQPRPEGIINARAYPIPVAWQRQDRNAKFELVPNGPGPLGEGHLLLQLHAMRCGERVYAANVGDPRDPARYSTRVTVDKRDDRPLKLQLRVGPRIRGDLHQIGVRVYDPAGKLALVDQAIKLGPTQYDAAGYPCRSYQASVDGPRGLWRVDVSSYALALYAPISEWREKQEGSGFQFPAY